MSHRVKPIFIFSLPRSGSTLLQRILGSHPDIYTVAETWILLPYIYTLREGGVFSEYRHGAMVRAIKDFCKSLPEGEETYLNLIGEFVQGLYDQSAPRGAKYFLDKTPRYHLIVNDIIEMFPDAKFMILWRNPLAIASSLNDTYADGKWRLYDFKIDLYEGMANLIDAYQSNKGNIYAVRYEDLLTKEYDWKSMFDFLELDFNENILSEFSNLKIEGRMGDPTGTKVYKAISDAPLVKWMQMTRSPIRRLWARRYLRWLGEERLKIMGYDYDGFMQTLSSNQITLDGFMSDVMRIVYGFGKCWVDPEIAKTKLKRIPDWRRIYPYS